MPLILAIILAKYGVETLHFIEGDQPDGRIRHYFLPDGNTLEINLDLLPAL